MTKLGMDPAEIRRLAERLDSQAESLEARRAHLDSIVRELRSHWFGNDAQQFVACWDSKHRPALEAATVSVRGLAQSARNNATEQESASGDKVAVSPHGHAPSPHSAPPSTTSSRGNSSAAPGGTGPNGTQDYSAQRSIEAARSEVGSIRPTGWNQPGECIKSVQRWIDTAGGHFGGGGPVSSYTNSGAVEIPISSVRAGDVLQMTHAVDADNNATGWQHAHTMLVAAVNPDGSLDIIQSNAPAGSGLVTEVKHWQPTSPYPNWGWRAWRFAAKQ